MVRNYNGYRPIRDFRNQPQRIDRRDD